MSFPRALALGVAAIVALDAGAGTAWGIGHGRDAVPGEQSWMGSMTFRPVGAKKPILCGAVLIAPDRALTAAHCLTDQSPREIGVAVGVDRLATARRSHASSAQARTYVRAAAFASHPRFRLLPSPAAPNSLPASGAEYDVGIIMLERPVTTIKPIPLARATPVPNAPAVVLGHGDTARGEQSRGHLRAGELVVLDDQRCIDAYGALFSGESMLCANDPTGPP